MLGSVNASFFKEDLELVARNWLSFLRGETFVLLGVDDFIVAVKLELIKIKMHLCYN